MKSHREILEILAGESLADKSFILPAEVQINPQNNRPEIKYFTLQKEKLFSAAQLS